jgi:hypothetical protein
MYYGYLDNVFPIFVQLVLGESNDPGSLQLLQALGVAPAHANTASRSLFFFQEESHPLRGPGYFTSTAHQ